MVKKKDSSSGTTPKKVTPKVSQKKVISPGKSSKKRLTPFNKIVQKNRQKRQSDDNIVEDEGPREVSKEKKKKDSKKCNQNPKKEMAEQETHQLKRLKKVNIVENQIKRGNVKKDIVGDAPSKKKKTVMTKEVSKKLEIKKKDSNKKTTSKTLSSKPKGSSTKPKSAKPVKKILVKIPAVKSTAKTTKKPAKTMPENEIKCKKRKTTCSEDPVKKSTLLSSGRRKSRHSSLDSSETFATGDEHTIECEPHSPRTEFEPHSPQTECEPHSPRTECEPHAPLEGVENYPTSDSLVMSSSPGLNASVVYGQGGDEHSLGTSSEAIYPIHGDRSRSPTPSPISDDYPDNGEWDEWGEDIMFGSDDHDDTKVNTDENEDLQTDANELGKKDHDHDDTKVNTDENEDLQTDANELGKKDHDHDDTKVNTDENEDLQTDANELGKKDHEPSEPDETSVQEEVEEIRETEFQDSNENVIKIFVEEVNHVVETELQESEGCVIKNRNEKEAEFSEVQNCFGFCPSPEKENSPLKRSIIEDDLCLSTSISQCSSRSSTSLGSFAGLHELGKSQKTKKNPACPLSLKLKLKRKNDAKSIGENQNEKMSFGSEDSCNSSGSFCNEHLDYSRKRNLPESPQRENDEVQCKKKRLQSNDSCSSANVHREPISHCRRSEQVSTTKKEYHYKGSPSSEDLSPTKVVKVLLNRLDVNNSEEPTGITLKQPKSMPIIPLKEAPMLSEKSFFGNQKPVLRSEIKTVHTHEITDRVSSKWFVKNHSNLYEELLLNLNLNSTKSPGDPLSKRFFQDYFYGCTKKKMDALEFHSNNNCTALHLLSKDCRVTLTKLECMFNEMESISLPSSSKTLTITELRNQNGYIKDDKMNIQIEKPKISRERITMNVDNNDSSAHELLNQKINSKNNENIFHSDKSRTQEGTIQEQTLSRRDITLSSPCSNYSSVKDTSTIPKSLQYSFQETGSGNVEKPKTPKDLIQEKKSHRNHITFSEPQVNNSSVKDGSGSLQTSFQESRRANVGVYITLSSPCSNYSSVKDTSTIPKSLQYSFQETGSGNVEKPKTPKDLIQEEKSHRNYITFSEPQVNNSSVKDGSGSLQSSFQESRRANVGVSEPPKNNCVKAVNFPGNSLEKDKNISPEIDCSRPLNSSEFSLQARPLYITKGDKINSETPSKTLKLRKADLIRRSNHISKQTINKKAKLDFNCTNDNTKESLNSLVNSPNGTKGNILSPIRRRVINNRTINTTEKSEHSVFKIPQNPVGKELETSTIVNKRNPFIKPSFNVETQSKEEENDQDDDNVSVTSCISLYLKPDDLDFVDDRIDYKSEEIISFRGNPDKRHTSNVTKSTQEAQETTHHFGNKSYTNNSQMNRNSFCELSIYKKGDYLKRPQNQNIRNKIPINLNALSPYHGNEDGKGGDKFANQIRVTNRNNEVDLMKHNNELRYGNHTKANITTEDQPESRLPSPRSRSVSSQSSSNNLYGSDNIQYENQLYGTPFDGHCLFYLRSSIVKNKDHQCDFKHEVPDLLFESITENYEFKKCTATGINRICRENCNKPPMRLLEGIAVFCTKNELKQELARVIHSLKNSISLRKVGLEQYKNIWTYFTKVLVQNISIWCSQNPETLIDMFLKMILVDNNGRIGQADMLILKEILVDLSRKSNNPTFKPLYCIKFLKGKRLPADCYPISFTEALMGQAVARAKTSSDITGFVYSVYKTFFNTDIDYKFLYKENKCLTEDFLMIVSRILKRSDREEQKLEGNDVEAKLNRLRNEGPVGPSGANNWQSNTEPTNSRHNKIPVPNHSKLNLMGGNNSNVTPPPVTLLREGNPKEVFNDFKWRGVSKYLEILHKFPNSVKKKNNDVTMSFILLESEKESWNNCYRLFQEMDDFDPRIVKDFTNENNTQARRLLVIIKCCLKSHHLKEAIVLFLSDYSKWLVKKSPEDEELWTAVKEDLEAALCNLSRCTETEVQLFAGIIQHQKHLRSPVYLLTALNNFFWKLAQLEDEGWNAMSYLVSVIHEENLIRKLNLDEVELYRILVRTVCSSETDEALQMKNVEICMHLMRKSTKICNLYPESWIKDSYEISVKSCLTTEEFYVIIFFKTKAFKNLIEMKSMHITFQESNIDPSFWRMSYFSEIDRSIKGAIERFKIACRRIGLNPSSLIVNGNKVTIDKVILIQNQ